MKRAVLHFRKIKTGSDMANIAAHNSMEKLMDETGGWKMPVDQLPEWVKHPDRVTFNKGQMGKQSDSIGRRWEGAVERAKLARKPQQNASRAIEAVFTASAGSFKTAGEWTAYLEGCRQWADQKFGHDNILQWNTHFHEKTPHAHAILVPIVRGEKNKYSSAEFLGGPEGLRQIQDEFAEFNLKYGLARGEPGSKKKHTDQSQWKSELIKQENYLEERERLLDMRTRALHKEEERTTAELTTWQEKLLEQKKLQDLREEKIKEDTERKTQAVDKIAAEKIGKDEGKKMFGVISGVFIDVGIQIPEIKKFWEGFFPRFQNFVKDYVQEIRQSLKDQRSQSQHTDRDRNSSDRSGGR